MRRGGERPDGRAGKKQILVACPTCRSGRQLSPDWKTPRTFPGQKTPSTLLGQNSFWILSENYFEIDINRYGVRRFLY